MKTFHRRGGWEGKYYQVSSAGKDVAYVKLMQPTPSGGEGVISVKGAKRYTLRKAREIM